jgi:beta-galactosidase
LLRHLLLCVILAAIAVQSAGAETVGPAVLAARHTSFNDDWRFRKGEAQGAEQSRFDDRRWMSLRLPHDWAVDGPFDRNINPHTGALPIYGTGWYRKTFTLPHNHYYAIEFDGAMANSTVWLNGHELGGRTQLLTLVSGRGDLSKCVVGRDGRCIG